MILGRWKPMDHEGALRIGFVERGTDRIVEVKPTRYGTQTVARSRAKAMNDAGEQPLDVDSMLASPLDQVLQKIEEIYRHVGAEYDDDPHLDRMLVELRDLRKSVVA